MKKLILSIATISVVFSATNEFNGYSYFTIGAQNFNYNERFVYYFNNNYIGENNKLYQKGTSVAVKSKINVTMPTYMSGSLIRFSDKIDLSMDFASTLKPKVTTEEWTDRGDDTTIISNYATIMSNSMKFLLHYKLTNNHRLTFGFSYILNTFKRFNDPDAQTTQLVEETSSTATVDLGYWFESNTAGKGLRIKYSITGGFPIYQDVTNTMAPNLKFDEKKGYNLDSSIYLGYSFYKGLEIGLYGGYSYMYREGETKRYKNQKVIWPTNITQIITAGLQVTWNFK